MQAEVLSKCRPFVEAFANCSKENGMMVVFKCREQNDEMNKCINDDYSQEKFEKYAIDHGYKLQKSFNQKFWDSLR